MSTVVVKNSILRVNSENIISGTVEQMSTPTWTEPSYPIVREEKFDEEVMKDLLNNPELPKDDKKKLSLYYRKRSGIGRTEATYDLAPAYKQSGLGRLYASHIYTLGGYRWEVRNPLAQRDYIDVDIVNCHWIIALKFAERFGIKHDCISEVVNNREAVLESIHDDRDLAKTQVLLRICYGGDLKLYDENIPIKLVDVKPGAKRFIDNLTKEIAALSTMIYDENSEHHSIKCTNGKTIKNQANPKASMMALVFHREERHMLMALSEELDRNGRYMGRYIHDGGHVEKLFPTETEVAPDILAKCEENILKCTGYSVKLKCKPITHTWKPYAANKDTYKAMKQAFERNTCLVGPIFWRMESNGNYSQFKVSEMRTITSTMTFNEENADGKIKKVKFLDKWLEDPEGRRYNRVDFYPNVSECPADVFNLFTGFQAEEFDEANPFESEEEDATLIAPILNHLNLITDGNSKFTTMWLADIIQHPARQSGISLLLRDMGSMLHEGGGTGKSWFFDWISRDILGEKYCVTVTDNSQLYSSFNSFLENKLFVIIEEASGKANHANSNTLKSYQTGNRMMVNKKGVAQYQINAFIRFIACTNDKNAMPIRQGDRRWAAFDTNPEKRGNIEYFTGLAAILKQDKVKAAFYRYLKNMIIPDSPIELMRSIPITNCYRDLRRINAPLLMKWVLHMLEKGTIPDRGVATTDLYLDFARWATETRERKTDNLMSQYQFSCELGTITSDSEDNGFGSFAMSGILKDGARLENRTKAYGWDVNSIMESFKRQLLIADDKEYTHGVGLTDKEISFVAPISFRRKKSPA